MPAKRGRPNQADLLKRIEEGKSSDGNRLKCSKCLRTFPRKKSLIAHERIHTGEKPYACSYPGCDASFKQSGQLKTHLGHHTGLQPFRCPDPGCNVRYLHSNRFCPTHKEKVRSDNVLFFGDIPTNVNVEQRAWIEEHRDKAERALENSHPNGNSENLEPSETNTISSDKSTRVCEPQPLKAGTVSTEYFKSDEEVALILLSLRNSLPVNNS